MSLPVFSPVFTAAALAAAIANPAFAQVQTEVPPLVEGAEPVSAEHIQIHGTSLEENLEGNAVDRDVIVFLPPSYDDEPQRRYPVVYALHGYSIGAEQWSQEIHVPQTIEGAFGAISIDVGDEDGLRVGTQELSETLDSYGIAHEFEIYPGTHTSGMAVRFQNHVMPFFSEHLCEMPGCQ